MLEENTTEIALLREQVEQLAQENSQYKHDIETTVGYIARLLTDLGLLTPDFQFQFSMKALTRSVMPLITNSAATATKFAYMADLRHIIERYGKQLQEKNNA